MIEARGVSGELRAGYQLAARLGPWEMAQGQNSVSLRATVHERFEPWWSWRPLDLALYIGGVEWSWRLEAFQLNALELVALFEQPPLVTKDRRPKGEGTWAKTSG